MRCDVDSRDFAGSLEARRDLRGRVSRRRGPVSCPSRSDVQARGSLPRGAVAALHSEPDCQGRRGRSPDQAGAGGSAVAASDDRRVPALGPCGRRCAPQYLAVESAGALRRRLRSGLCYIHACARSSLRHGAVAQRCFGADGCVSPRAAGSQLLSGAD